MSSTLSLFTPSLVQGLHLEMIFFGRIIRLPASVTRAQWDSYIAGLQQAAARMKPGVVRKIPGDSSPDHFKHLLGDILAAWHLAKEHGPFTPLLNLISHIRTLEAVSTVDEMMKAHDTNKSEKKGICLWTGPALEEAIAWPQTQEEDTTKIPSDEVLAKAVHIATRHVLSKAEVQSLPSLLRHRSVDSLRHLTPDMVLRILDGIAQFEAASRVPAAIARSFRRALEVLCPELLLPLSGESQLITPPSEMIIPRTWGLKPAATPSKPTPRRPSPAPRRGPGVKG